MKELLKSLNQRPVAFYPLYVAGTGSISSGVALSQLMYWFSKQDKIYKTDKEFEKETGHTAKEMQVVRKHLRKLPFLTITREGVPAKTHYAIDWDLYQSSMHQWSELKNNEGIVTRKSIKDSTIGADCTPPIVQTITESTQEITTESKVVPDKSATVATAVDDVTPEEISATMVEAIEVAEHLSARLSDSIEKFKSPTTSSLKGWAKDIELAIRKDNRTKQELIATIDWIHDDSNGSFWIGNIMSGKKLREKFDMLTVQRTSSTPKVSVRTKAVEAFGLGKVFFEFKDIEAKIIVQVCIFGDHAALYDFNGHKYISKEKADKLWKLIESDFDNIVSKFKKIT